MFKKIAKNKFIFSFSLLFLLVGLFFIFPHPANAFDIAEYILTPFAWVIFYIVKLLAGVLIVIIQILISVCTYNDFINAPAIIEGWIIIRDLANMFFVIVLLIIAISTILGIETYNYKKLLPKLLLMAILINFSKMICGLLIDCSQIVTMTFVDGFKNAAAGNLATGFGLDQLLMSSSNKADSNATSGAGELIGALLLALILVIVAISVTLGTILIFLIRIIMLWFLVVLSPLAYLLSAFPGGASYAQEWWKEFTKYLIVGPAMAFFLWLSLMVMSTVDAGKSKGFEELKFGKEQTSMIGGASEATGGFAGEGIYASISTISNSSHLLTYIIAIGMLCGSMIMAQRLGVAGAGAASGILGRLKKAGMGTAKWAGMRPFRMASRFGKKLYAGKVLGGAMKGILLNPAEIYRRLSGAKKEEEEGFMRKGDVQTGINIKSGGLKGAILGMGAQSYFNNYITSKGMMGLKNVSGMIKTGWSAQGSLEDTENEMKNIEGNIAKQITIKPSDESISRHMDEFIKTNPGASLTDEDNEKQKFIADWKVEEAKKICAGPSEAEIKQTMTAKGISRNDVIEDWNSDKRNEYGMTGFDRKEFDSNIKTFNRLDMRKKDIQEFTPDTTKDRIKERSFISESKEKIKDFNIPLLIEQFKKAESGKDIVGTKVVLSLLAEKGGLDDLIKDQGFTDDTNGYINFMKQKTKGLQMNSQEALEFQTDIGSIADREGQTRYSRTTKVNKNGEYEERTEKEIDEIRYTEIGIQKGARKIFQDIPDHIVENGKITNPGKLLIKDHFEAMEGLLKRGELNPKLIEQLSSQGNLLRGLWKNEKDQTKVEALINDIQSRKGSIVDRFAELTTPISPREKRRDLLQQQKQKAQKTEARKKIHAEEIYKEKVRVNDPNAGDHLQNWKEAEKKVKDEDDIFNEVNNITSNVNKITNSNTTNGVTGIDLKILTNAINKLGGTTLGSDLNDSLQKLKDIKTDNSNSLGQTLTIRERKIENDNYSRLMIELLRKIEKDLKEGEDK